MYYTGKNPLGKIGYKSEDVVVPRGDKQRRLHKALLRYHDPANWPLIRQALEDMGKKHLIGGRRECLVPAPTLEEMREPSIRQSRTSVRHLRRIKNAGKSRGANLSCPVVKCLPGQTDRRPDKVLAPPSGRHAQYLCFANSGR